MVADLAAAAARGADSLVIGVAPQGGGLPEVVEHGATGFLHDPGHVAGFVASVLKLLGNEPLRRRLGRRARRVARERFSPDEMVGRYIRVYDSLR